MLFFLDFGSVAKVLIVMLTLPFATIGGIWLLYLLGYNMSVAVMVGFIALAGVTAEIGVVMIVYLDEAYEAMLRERDGQARREDLYGAIMKGAAERVRPIMMTVFAVVGGLL